MDHEIYIERKGKIYLEPGNSTNPEIPYIATILKNIESLGYMLSDHVIEILKTYTKEQLEIFYFDLVSDLRKIVGSDIAFVPSYPDFPPQVMDKDSSLEYINALMGHFTMGHFYSVSGEMITAPFLVDASTVIIEIGTKDEFLSLFINLMCSHTTFSKHDKRHLVWFIRNCQNFQEFLPNSFPLKENTAYICRYIIEESPLPSISLLNKYIYTPTEVLRLAVAMSDGDISLKSPCKFRKFRRKERRILLELLEYCKVRDEEMFQYRNRFIRLGERLHPGEYEKQYPNTALSFYKIRNNKKVETFTSRVADCFQSGNYRLGVSLLKQFPEQLAKRLDYLIRVSGNPIMVINDFMEIASKLPTPALWQIREHFAKRNYNPSNTRVFFPKGKTSKPYAIPNTLPVIDQSYCESIVETCETELITHYQGKEPLGKVYINEALKDYIVPLSPKNFSGKMRALASGSKISFKEGIPVFRSFVWWRNGDSLGNIKITAVMYDKYWNYIGSVSPVNNFTSGCISSGSLQPLKAVKGYSQYIDFDMASALKTGGRYLVLLITNETGKPLNSLSKCYVGYMERQRIESAEIYEPQSLETKFAVTVNTPLCLPMIIDLQKSFIHWTDLPLKSEPLWDNDRNNLSSVPVLCKSLIEPEKPNLFDFLELHCNARGERCFNKEIADVVFDINDGITPYDLDIITNEYL